ncbi:unnamed protein product [Discosporangium mesarthrocarpum]
MMVRRTLKTATPILAFLAVGHAFLVHHTGPHCTARALRKVQRSIALMSVETSSWDVDVELHGDHTTLKVYQGDTFLEAAEMAGLTVSYDCRRGNCISCAAKICEDSTSNLVTFAQERSATSDPEGYILTCCSFPIGPGVKLSLGRNAEMWEDFSKRFNDEETRDMLRQAEAETLRDYAQSHPKQWVKTVEAQFTVDASEQDVRDESSK